MSEPAARPGTPGGGAPGASSSGVYRRTRRKLGRWRRSVSDPGNLRGRLDKQRTQLDRLAKQIAELTSTVTTLGKRLRPVELASSHRELEHGRVAIQVGVIEERLGRIEERLRGDSWTGDSRDQAEARSLVSEIRREHEQVRIRMQVIGQYEERLRRLEDAVVKMYRGDVRHPF